VGSGIVPRAEATEYLTAAATTYKNLRKDTSVIRDALRKGMARPLPTPEQLEATWAEAERNFVDFYEEADHAGR
jgi:hypothetical protein